MTQTVLLTGASGYIAKHVAVALLNRGYNVRGSVRAMSRADEVRDAVKSMLADPSDLEDRLTFVSLDLGSDDGWDAALQGVDALVHTASPFPLEQPRDEDELIRPAVDGTLRALRAAQRARVSRVVMTSSVVAISPGYLPEGKVAHTEDDWTDILDPNVSPYGKSKTLAEKAAWDFVAEEASGIALTTINPSLVIGPPLDRNYGTSVSLIERLLAAKDPMLPNICFGCVDVRDVAAMHVLALDKPETAGERFIASDRTMTFVEIAKALKAGLPDRKIVARQAPGFVIRLLARFDKSIKTILPILDKRDAFSNAKARDQLGITFRDTRNSMVETAQTLLKNGWVK